MLDGSGLGVRLPILYDAFNSPGSAMNVHETVVVTGASGFIAKHCILELLLAGYRVIGTVRHAQKGDRLRETLAKYVENTDLFEWAVADLSSDQGWDDVLRFATAVLHVASPFPPVPPAHEDDLIAPAREGTLRVLSAAARARVKRVVLTSSIAAILSGRPREGGEVYDEETWSDTSQKIGAYEKSKTLAERAAWDLVAALPSEERFELVVVNPGVVLGPLLDESVSTSIEFVKKLMRREVPGCAPLGFAVVDVRDVAKMHLLALTTPEAAGQRFVCAGKHVWMLEVARILDRHFGGRGYRIPTRRVPGWVLSVVALFDKSVRIVLGEVGKRQDLSHDKASRILGWTPRPIEETVVATGESLIRFGRV